MTKKRWTYSILFFGGVVLSSSSDCTSGLQQEKPGYQFCAFKLRPLTARRLLGRSIQRQWVLREHLMRGVALMQTIFSNLSLSKMPADLVEHTKCKLGSAPLMQSYYVSSRAKEGRAAVQSSVLYQAVTGWCQQTTSVALPRRAGERWTYCTRH